MQKSERISAVSWDSMGALFLTPEKLKATLPPSVHVRHAEAIAWGPVWRLNKLLGIFDASDIQTHHIHGPIGLESRHVGIIDDLKILGIDRIMVSVPKLLKHFPDRKLLIHTPAATKAVLSEIKRVKPPFVYIEDHKVGQEGLGRCEDIVNELTDAGVRSGIALDGAHWLGPEVLTGPAPAFYRQYGRLLKARQNSLIVADHIPVGTDPEDTYPRHRMSLSMWHEYKDAQGDDVDVVVVENQIKKHALGMRMKDAKALAMRNALIFRMLQESGVVDFS